jgi:K+-sensing histidine kinase KdpD
MENLLLLLPARPQSLAIRYAVTTLIVLVCFLLQIGVEMQSGFFGFFLLLPGIFLASVLFDRGSGFYATLLSTILSIFVLSPPGTLVLPAQQLLPVLLFVLIGLAVATVSEALRKALEHAMAAERAKDLLMHELNHRIRNNLAMVASVLELQMRAQREPLAKQALATAVARIHVIANAHDHLMPRDGHSAIDMNEYLTKCCRHLGDALRDVRPIAINVSAAQIYLRSDKAVAILTSVRRTRIAPARRARRPWTKATRVKAPPPVARSNRRAIDALVLRNSGKPVPLQSVNFARAPCEADGPSDESAFTRVFDALCRGRHG